MHKSANDYDWLGPGVYFWQDSEDRAWSWAREPWRKSIKTPAVISARISLGYCCDMLKKRYREMLKEAYEYLLIQNEKAGRPLPVNSAGKKNGRAPDGGIAFEVEAEKGEKKFRYLDCAVFMALHQLRYEQGLPSFDTVRATFQEGDALYPGACIGDQDHIQIAVLNSNCIKVLRP
jgi:hypothetical protein